MMMMMWAWRYSSSSLVLSGYQFLGLFMTNETLPINFSSSMLSPPVGNGRVGILSLGFKQSALFAWHLDTPPPLLNCWLMFIAAQALEHIGVCSKHSDSSSHLILQPLLLCISLGPNSSTTPGTPLHIIVEVVNVLLLLHILLSL